MGDGYKMSTIYEINYRKLENLGIIQDGKIAIAEYEKLKSGSYMDLSIDRISSNKLAIAHNHIQNGDVVPDPDMTLKVYLESKMVEALTYQDSMTYTVVYPEEGKVNPRAKKELNDFLGQWLSNLKRQGFMLYPKTTKEDPKLWDQLKKDSERVYAAKKADKLRNQQGSGWHKHPELHAEAARKGQLTRRGY